MVGAAVGIYYTTDDDDDDDDSRGGGGGYVGRVMPMRSVI